MGETKIFLAVFLILAYATGIAAAATYSEDLCVNGTPLSGGSAWSDLAYVFDDSLSTRGHSVDGNVTNESAWVGYQFLDAQPISRIALSQHTSLNGIEQVEVQYSDDGQIWTTLETLQVQKQVDPIVYYNITASGAHQYWRLMADENVGDADGWYVAEVEMQKEITATRVNYIKSYDAQAKKVSIKSSSAGAGGASIMAEQPYLDIELVSAKPSIAQFEVIFAITAHQDWVINLSQDFATTFTRYVGRHDIDDVEWWVQTTIQRDVETPLFGTDVGDDELPVVVGTEINTVEVQEWQPFNPEGVMQPANSTVCYKALWTKLAETGNVQIHTVPMFAGIDCPELTWWNISWQDCARINVANPSDIEGYQVAFNLTHIIGMNDNFSDIRFVDASNSTECAYWIDEKLDGYYANLWVALPANDTYINLYYNNTGAASVSNSSAVFIDYDDFTTYNDSSNLFGQGHWTKFSGNAAEATFTESDDTGIISTTGASGYCYAYWGVYETNITLPFTIEYRAKAYHISASDNDLFYNCIVGDSGWQFATLRWMGGDNSESDLYYYTGSQYSKKFDGLGNTFYEVKLDVLAYNNVQLYVDGTSYGNVYRSESASEDDEFWYFNFGVYDYPGRSATIDYVRIRNYEATEPSLTLLATTMPPIAGFTANATIGVGSLTVQFNDTSTNTPTAWNWSFGDGNYSSDQNPVHTYSSTGIYDVTLTVSNEGGSRDCTKEDYVGVWGELRSIDVDVPSSIDGYQAYFNLTYLEGMNSNFSDIRFLDTDMAAIPYWIDEKSDGNYAEVWIALPAGATSINLVYNNSEAPDAGDADAVFEFYDDFETGVLSKVTAPDWTISSTAYEGSYSAYRAGTCKCLYAYFDEALSAYTVEMAVRASETNQYHYPCHGPAYSFVMKPDGHFGYNTGSTYKNFPTDTTYAANTWYTIRMDFNFSDDCYDVYVNGVNKGRITDCDGVNGETTRDVHTVLSTSSTGSGGLYIDDMRVRHYAATEPTLTLQEVTPPVANFTANATYGLDSLTVQFNDTSTNTPTAWNWSFGDGNYSTDQNASHMYVSLGLFDVKLHVQNDDGDAWKNQTQYINVSNLLVANFTATIVQNVSPFSIMDSNFTGNTTTGDAPLTIQFNSTSINATAWNWSFGDGNYSSVENPLHTYRTLGLFTVSLTVENAFGNDTKERDNYINVTNNLTANFTSNVTKGEFPLTIQFNSTSINATAWNWSFGDGNYSSLENPVFTYNTTGLYNVTLIVTNAFGSANRSVIDYINVTNRTPYPPEANFTSNATSGYTPLAIQFNSTSINATAWNWSFGDGVYSTNQNATHTYLSAGTYDVKLHVQNDDGDDWKNETGYIEVSTWVSANFTANRTIVNIDLNQFVQFTSTSANATLFNWTFGDGSVSTDENPLYNYSQAGNFTVNLTASDGYSNVTFSREDYIWAGHTPVAKFTARPCSGDAPLNVTFSASIAEYALAYNWSFGDGYYAETCNTSHIYTNAGTYTVNLTVTNPFGTDTLSATNLVTVYGDMDANFIYNATTGQVPLSIQFNDTSVGTYDSWFWDFGDGTNSTSRNVTHTYTEVGTYTVSLTADGSHGDDTETKTDLITAWDVPDAEFTASTQWGISPLIVKFTDTSTGLPTHWNWSFGDGTYSTSQSPYHTYTSDGTYTVKLWANNSHGGSWENKTAHITVTSYNPLSTSAICPKYHYDVQNSNRCPYSIGLGGWEEWTSDPLGDPADAMNTIFTVTSNGTVLTGIENQYYYALDGSDGSVLWQNDTADDARGAAAIAEDGTIYVAQESGGSLVAYNEDGSIKWQTTALGTVVGMPTIGETGVVYCLGHNGSGNYLHALNPNTGDIWWSQSLGVYPSGCPAILDTGGQEHIIICSDNIDTNYVYMVTNASGTPSLNWSYSLGDACGPNSPVVDEDSNIIYVLTYATLTSSSTLYAFDETGSKQWDTSFTGYAKGVTLDDDGYPYVFFDDGSYHYLKGIFPPTGAVMWTTQISYGDEAPIYTNNGYLVSGGYYGYDIVDTDGNLINDVSIRNGDTPYVLGAEGLLYCSAIEGSGKKVIAFNTSTEPKLVADFEVSETTGTVPIHVQFTDTSTNTSPITSWSWSLDEVMVSEQNPSYTYENAGTFSIALFIQSADGSSQMIRTNYLTFTNSSHSADYTGRYPECEYVRTLGATEVSSSEATLWGEVVNYTGTLETWFEYGTKSNSYGYSTKAYSTQATDTFSRDLAGLEHGLIAGETIYYRAACEYGFGEEMCVTLTSLSPHATTNYGIDTYQFVYGYDDSGYTFDYSSADINDDDNRDLAGDMTTATWSPYVATMGAFFFALVLGAIMANMAMKQRSIIIPALVTMFIGGMIWELFPPEAVQFAQVAFIVGIAGIVYWVVTRRR